jgi:hypothetical protein
MGKEKLPEGWKVDPILVRLCAFVWHGRDAPQGLKTKKQRLYVGGFGGGMLPIGKVKVFEGAHGPEQFQNAIRHTPFWISAAQLIGY